MMYLNLYEDGTVGNRWETRRGADLSALHVPMRRVAVVRVTSK
jgi:hypothetical protein